MRLFVAVSLPDEVKRALAQQQKPAKAPGIRWTEPSQMHVTVCFLGEVAEIFVDAIRDRLRLLSSRHEPFTMRIARLRFKQPAMIWAEIESSGAFDQLSVDAHQEMAKIDPGFVRIAEEMRPPRPHITLARLGRGAGAVKVTALDQPLAFRVDSIELMESKLYPTGPVYETLDSFTLTKTSYGFKRW